MIEVLVQGEDGELDHYILEDTYLLLTAGTAHVSSLNAWPSTHQITIKGFQKPVTRS